MKQVVYSLLFAASIAVIFNFATVSAGSWPDSCGKNKTHNFLFGRKGPHDRLLYVNHTAVASKWRQKHSFDVQIPPKGEYRRSLISAVEVLDQYHDGNGACAFLKSGGPNYYYVKLHFKSQRGKGVNSIINVYGH